MYIYNDLVVVDSFNYTDLEYEKILNQMKEVENAQILINREQALSSQEEFKKLCSDFKGHDIIISFVDDLYAEGYGNNDIFDEEETKILKENYKVCKAQGCELYLSDLPYNFGEMQRNKIPFTKSLQASERLNSWVAEIENARIDGKPLSPFEKYIYAYMIVTDFKYNEAENINDARDLSRVLTGNKIVCVGFAHLLSELCGRIGIACKPQALYKGFKRLRKENQSNHENCMVYLNDPKYNIDGFFMADACWDSYKSFDKPKTLTHSLIKYSDIPKIFKHEKGLTFVDDQDEKRSSFKFLKRLGVVSDIRLINGEINSEMLAKSELKNGKLNDDLISFVLNSFEDVFDELESDESQVKDLPEIENVEEGYKLATKFAGFAFCGDCSNNICVDPDEAYEEFMNVIKAMQIKFSVTANEFADNVIQNFKNLDIENDRALLTTFASYLDKESIEEVYDKLNDIKLNFTKGPTYQAYKQALENVFVSKGMRKEKATKNAEKKLKQSVAYAYAYWEDAEGAENVFAKMAMDISKMQSNVNN